jgi:hypothetical protein
MKHAVIVSIVACLFATHALAQHKHGAEPAAGGVVSLDGCADGAHVHLLTATRAEGQPARLQYQRSDDSGATWSAPVTLGTGQPPTIAKRGMDAQIAAAGEQLVAVWPTAGSDKMGRGPMATAVSSDGGRTWRAGPNPADDNLTIGHSFIDVAADAKGQFHLVWLDSREGGAKGLRYARSTNGGVTWSANQTLDADTCECCWNTVTTGGDGTIAVLYRDASPRDMAIVTSTNGGATWSTPVAVGKFDWGITACPHVGGALAANGDAMHALVWTAKDNDVHGVFSLNSTNAGVTWNAPVRIGPHEASRPDLAVDKDGRLIATWDAGRAIYVTSSTNAGQTWSAGRRLNENNASGSHPRLIRTAGGVRAFWTETPAGKPANWASAPVAP